MKNFKTMLTVAFASVVSSSLFAFTPLKAGSNETRIARVVGQYMPRMHYSKLKLSDDLSEKWFDNYIKALDANKYFFTQQDIDELSKYRDKLEDNITDGDTEFAYLAFNMFLGRVEERVAWAIKRLETPFDYTKNERILFDRKDEPWAKSEDEIRDLWRKRIKNSLLLYTMIDESMAEKKKDNSLDKAEKKALKDEQLFPHKSPKERVVKNLEQLKSLYFEMDAEDVLELYLTAFANVYDPHSNYMSPKTMEGFNMSMSLSLKGIGATLQNDQGFTKVVSLVPGGPADKQGELQAGDRIIAVAQGDGEPVDIIDWSISKVVKIVRGEKGTVVRLTVFAADKGFNSKPKTISITRDKVQLKESEAKGEVKEVYLSSLDPKLREIILERKVTADLAEVKDESKPVASKKEARQELDKKFDEKVKIGVITVPSFYADFKAVSQGDPNAKTLTTDVINIIMQMRKEKIDGLILDLRSNGGGSLDEAIRMTGLFIPEGPVVQICSGKGLSPRVKSDESGLVYYDGPLVVMVNKFSASASEIFAGAIQDYHRGVIVGDKKTHGKGTVQTVFDLDRLFRLPSLFKLPPSGTLKFTIQKFYRVTGASTQKKGVVPDIIFPSYTDYMETGEEQLPHVLEWDETSEAKFTAYDKANLHLDVLRKQSIARRQSDEKFKLLTAEILDFKKEMEDKSLSLNKKTREAKRKKNEAQEEKRKKLLHLNSRGEDDADNEEEDLYLDETINIMVDAIKLRKK